MQRHPSIYWLGGFCSSIIVLNIQTILLILQKIKPGDNKFNNQVIFVSNPTFLLSVFFVWE